MKYIEPKITNTLKADSTIHGFVKGAGMDDSTQNLPSSGIGYRADE
jgi:hypothetical protein